MANTKVLTQVLGDLAIDREHIPSVGLEREPASSEALRSALKGDGRPLKRSGTRRRRPARVPTNSRSADQELSADAHPNGSPLVHDVDCGVIQLPSPEIELKLLVEPDELAALIDSPPVVASARNKGAMRLIKDTYYDTAAGALRRASVTLRVRQCGKRFVQTVKVAPIEPGMPLCRSEWEFPVAGMAPDFQAVAPLMAMGLQDALTRDPLRPIFTIELHRRLRTLVLPNGTVEISFDTGTVKSGERTAPICEVEIELKSGRPAAAYELAMMLAEHAAVRPTTSTKADRGFDLAFETAPAVHGPSPLLPRGETSLDEALTQLLRSALRQLLLNTPAAESGRNPEGVHQLRIALRRLRCALAMLRPLAPSAMLESLRADARWLAANLAAARNWDVFLGETLSEVAHGCSTVAGFDSVRDMAEQFRQAGYVAARAALADRRASRFELGLGAWIEQRGWRCDGSGDYLLGLAGPAIDFAERALAKQHDRVLKRGRHFKRLPLEARHDLRLAVKKLRYTADFFLPLFAEDGGAKRYARRLSRLQERLGRYNDAATTRHLMAELASDAMPATAREALGAVLGWQACRLANAEAEVRAGWREFRAAPRPWAGRRGGWPG